MIYAYDGVHLEPPAVTLEEADERACEWWAAQGRANPYIGERRRVAALLAKHPNMRRFTFGN
jgi:hypothetical protein